MIETLLVKDLPGNVWYFDVPLQLREELAEAQRQAEIKRLERPDGGVLEGVHFEYNSQLNITRVTVTLIYQSSEDV